MRKCFGSLDLKLLLEPGRLIVANAGILVTRVINVKKGDARTFVIVDAAMNDLIRPTLYEAYHDIWPVTEKRKNAGVLADVVGPVCETGDYLALGRKMPAVAADELLAIMGAGAYGAVQAGTYNSRQLVPEVMVRGDQFAVVRPRQTYDELIGLDQLAPWLMPARAEPVKASPAVAARKPEAATSSAGASSAAKRPSARRS